MAADDALDELTSDPEAGLKKKKITGKLLIIILLPVLLMVFGGGAFMLGVFDSKSDQEAAAHGAEPGLDPNEPRELIFYEVPEMLVNLNTGGAKKSFLKLKISLEVDRQSSVVALDDKLPRVVDNFQIYLRELRVEDLSGSAGMFRLKEEMLRRVNQSIAPSKVNDVLFKELLVQ